MGDLTPGSMRLDCYSCGTEHEATHLQTVCRRCGLPLRAVVGLDGLRSTDLVTSDPTMWRYSPVLPVPYDSRISLGEGWTPIHKISDNIHVKDESVNPTGSFKDRGMSMAVSVAKQLGVRRLVAPSAGNAAVALAAYGREAGIPVFVVMPLDTPQAIVTRCIEFGAEVVLVDGDISAAGRWLAEHRSHGDFDVSTLKEPYRVEGKKTMGYELWEQFGGDLPTVIVYPTGGGTGLVGMWKAFGEMEQMGWIGPSRPRLVSVQAAGCAPIVKAFLSGARDVEPWPDPITTAWGLRVPSPIAGFLCLRAIAETGGAAVAVAEADIHSTAARVGAETGIDFCPEAGAAWAAMEQLASKGVIGADDRVLVWNTGSGAAYR